MACRNPPCIGQTGLAPFSFEQRLERSLVLRHLQLPEDIGFVGGLMLGFDIDFVRVFRVRTRTDQDKFGTFEAEQMGIVAGEASLSKPPLHDFG